jgi:hypothetical protein
MPRFKATAYIDGKETEVELDDEKFITVDQHKLRLNRTVQDRLGKQAANVRKELAGDAEFVTEILKAKGIDPTTLKPAGGEGGKGLTEADVARLQTEWRTKELEPVTTKLTAAEKRLADSNARTLESDLTRALIEAGAKKSLAGRIAKMEAGSFGVEDTTGMHAVREGEGFAFSTKATKERPFKGVDEWAAEWAANKENAELLERTTQRGPGVGDPPRGTPTAGGKRSEMTVAQRSEYIEKNGFEAFTNLPA